MLPMLMMAKPKKKLIIIPIPMPMKMKGGGGMDKLSAIISLLASKKGTSEIDKNNRIFYKYQLMRILICKYFR